MSPYVSIIVPVYNSERYLQECIDSILAQSYINFEIILVNDGSKDDSGKICDKNALKDSRITVVHQANTGVTAARRNGLKLAKSAWICFVDSDDTIPPTAIEALVHASQSYDCDFVVGHLREVQIMPPSIITLERWREICISGTPFLPGPWCRLIRKSLFDNWTLDIPREIIKGEDMLMNIRLAFNMTKNVVEVHQKVYNYCPNPNSCLHTFNENIEYSYQFHLLQKSSIPNTERERFMHILLNKRLAEIRAKYRIRIPEDSFYNENFTQDVLADIKLNNYKIGCLDHAMLTRKDHISKYYVFISLNLIHHKKLLIYSFKRYIHKLVS